MLGFTVAEALLLILFGILLALGSIIVTKNTERDLLQTEVDVLRPKIAAIEAIQASYPTDAEQNFDDFFGELTLAISERDAAKAQLAILTEKAQESARKLEELGRVSNIIEEAAKNGVRDADAVRKAAARGDIMKQFFPPELSPEQIQALLQLASDLDRILPPADSPDRDDAEETALKTKQELEEMRKALRDLQRSQERLQGQLANASRRLKQDGLGYPACWARKVGTPDYIYSIALRPDGIVIHDNKLPEWADEQKVLPSSREMFGQPLSAQQFRTMTKPLFDISEERDCRFFVQVYDMTGRQDKLRYKQLMGAVESHFYKYEVQDLSSWAGPAYFSPEQHP